MNKDLVDLQILMFLLIISKGYCRGKWNWRPLFKPWKRLFVFHIALLPMRNELI